MKRRSRLAFPALIAFGLVSALPQAPARAQAQGKNQDQAQTQSQTPAQPGEVIYPTASRLGLVPLPGFTPATGFFGFENLQREVFVRLVTLPGPAFAEIEKTMTNAALKKQGMDVERRESLALKGSKGILVMVHQDTPAGPISKWLLIAPVDDVTALASFEMTAKPPAPYTDAQVRSMLATLAARPSVPDNEQLTLVPFKVGDTAGMRVVRVVPGVAVQFTDGPKDTLEATEQPHLIIAAAAGGPEAPGDRDRFARDVMTGLPPFKDVRITSSDSMRIGGQPGHEIRAQGKDAQTGADLEIVQWLRFGTGAYIRILGYGPKKDWMQTFMRFREVRDGLEPR